MFNFSIPELILILVVALVIFGPSKLPEVGKALGRGITEFRNATTSTPEKQAIEVSVVQSDSKPDNKVERTS